MAKYRRLWFLLIGILAVTFTLLGYFGAEVYREAPPIPDRVVPADGDTLMTEESTLDGHPASPSAAGTSGITSSRADLRRDRECYVEDI